jgi:hypothetical protein
MAWWPGEWIGGLVATWFFINFAGHVDPSSGLWTKDPMFVSARGPTTM